MPEKQIYFAINDIVFEVVNPSEVDLKCLDLYEEVLKERTFPC